MRHGALPLQLHLQQLVSQWYDSQPVERLLGTLAPHVSYSDGLGAADGSVMVNDEIDSRMDTD